MVFYRGWEEDLRRNSGHVVADEGDGALPQGVQHHLEGPHAVGHVQAGHRTHFQVKKYPPWLVISSHLTICGILAWLKMWAQISEFESPFYFLSKK